MKSLSDLGISFDPVKLIQKLIKKLKSDFELTAKIGAELEFYLVHQDEDEEKVLELISAKCDRIDKERGWHQHECMFNFTDDLCKLAQDIIDIKPNIVVSARQNGIKAVFDAKPFDNDYGSALHLHLSLHNKYGTNIFADLTCEENQYLQNSIGGILDITEESVFLLCANENDFKRFQDNNFLAPTHTSWGGNNRTTIIRIPDSEPKFRRIEFRLPPANTNPYNAIAIVLIGVMHGLKNKISPIERTYGNAFDEKYGLLQLPKDLLQAQNIFENKGNLAHYIRNLG